jgi:hypothetical protein
MGNKVVCLGKPETMPEVLARNYPDFPLSDMPSWAIRVLARRWRQRPEV